LYVHVIGPAQYCNTCAMMRITAHPAVKRMDVQGFVSKKDGLGKPDHKKDRLWLIEQR
jgi:hypothetical protein